MVVEKCKDMLGDGVLGRDNGEARNVGFMDFGEEVESRGLGIWRREISWEERLWRGTSVLKEDKGLVVGDCRFMREKMVGGSIRQLSVDLSKIVILVEDHSGILPLSAGRIKMWGLDLREWRA